MNNSPNTTPSITEEMIEAGAKAFLRGGPAVLDAAAYTRIYLAMKSAAPQHTGLMDRAWQAFNEAKQAGSGDYGALYDALRATTPAKVDTGLTDVKRLLREARSYVEQAGLRHHDVSGLLAEIDAVLLVSNRSGVERLKGVIYRNCDPFDATAEDAQVIQEIANEMAALDTPTINEGEGQ